MYSHKMEKRRFRGVKTSYCERKKAWKNLWKDFPEGGIYDTAKKICKKLNFSDKSQEELQRAMLGLYSGIHFEAEKNIEGIFVGYLQELKIKKSVDEEVQTNYLSGSLWNFRGETGDQKPPFDWFVLESGDILKKYQNIRDPIHVRLYRKNQTIEIRRWQWASKNWVRHSLQNSYLIKR